MLSRRSSPSETTSSPATSWSLIAAFTAASCISSRSWAVIRRRRKSFFARSSHAGIE